MLSGARLPKGFPVARLSGLQGTGARDGLSGARGPETGDQAFRILPIPGDRGPVSGGQAFRIPGARGLSGGQGPGLPLFLCFFCFNELNEALHILNG